MKLFYNNNRKENTLLERLRGADIDDPPLYDYNKNELEENCVWLVDLYELLESIHMERPIVSKFNDLVNKKLIIYFHYKTIIDENFFSYMARSIEKLIVETKDVFVILQTKPDIDYMKVRFPNFTYVEFDKWLDEYYQMLIIRYLRDLPFRRKTSVEKEFKVKRFSICIRRFEEIRFKFMCDLIKADILDSFHFTFTAGCGRDAADTMPLEDIRSIIDKEKYINCLDKINAFVDGIPYAAGDTLGHDPYPQQVDEMIKQSMINVVFETRIDNGGHELISEKTYKPIFLSRPFILFCKPHALKFLKELGFKTFSPHINESYDEIEDDQLRQEAIIREIKRLYDMPDPELQIQLSIMSYICDYNFNVLMKKIFAPFPEEITYRKLGLYD